MKLTETLTFLKYYPYRMRVQSYANRHGKKKLIIKFYSKEGNFNSIEDIDEALETFFPWLDPETTEVEFKTKFNYVYIRIPLEDKRNIFHGFNLNFSRKPFTDEE